MKYAFLALRGRRLLLPALVLGNLFLFSGCLLMNSDKRVSLAVLDLEPDKDIKQVDADKLSIALRAEFSKVESLKVIPGRRMAEIAKRKGIKLTGCRDRLCLAKIGEALNVDKVIYPAVDTSPHHRYLIVRSLLVKNVEIEWAVMPAYDLAAPESTACTAAKGIAKYWRLESLRRQARLNPKDIDRHQILGAVLWKEWGYYTEAIAEYREILRLNPEDSRAHLSIAKIYLDWGRHSQEAEKEVREAIRVTPNYTESLELLDFIQKRRAKYLETLKENEKLRPEDKIILEDY